jgi:hypothetical protein
MSISKIQGICQQIVKMEQDERFHEYLLEAAFDPVYLILCHSPNHSLSILLNCPRSRGRR